MHVAAHSLKFQAGNLGLAPFRFCMPSSGLADPSKRGHWFNDAFGRRMVPVAITDRAVEPGEAFRAIMPYQEVCVELSETAGASGDWVVCGNTGTAVPITDGVTHDSIVAGILLEDGQPGEVVRMLFWPLGHADLGEEQVLVP